MKILFEYPYVIITIFVLCFLILGGIGLFFARQGLKTAKGMKEIDFSSIYKLENIFEKMLKARMNRCVIYISISLDNIRSLYSDAKANRIFSELKPFLLKGFSTDLNSGIALYDGNNFAVLNGWSYETAKEKIEAWMEVINPILTKHHCINDLKIHFGCYSVFTTEINFKEAIIRAKEACTIAKNEAALYVEWSNKSRKDLEYKIKIENNIENEIDNNRFFLEYQPVICAKDKKIVGAEVLARLHSEDGGIINPGKFLDAVTSTGLSDKFDYYIFEKNCKWVSNNKNEREKFVYTINFSRSTLCEPEFAEKVINICDKYNLNATSLAVEILEDKAINQEERMIMKENLLKIKEKGLLILLDDFGSGYTAFTDLASLNITTVKIDKEIIHNADSQAGFLILKNIIRTAKDLGYKTVCEGIENAGQEEAAIKAECDMLQGYYYYRPMPVSQFENLCNEQ